MEVVKTAGATKCAKLQLHLNSHFPGEPGPEPMSPPTNQHPIFYRPYALPVTQLTVSMP